MLSTDPSHRPRIETEVGSCRSISSSLGVRRGSDLAVWRAGDTPPARTERATKSVSSRAHSRRVCSCAYAMTSDCRHRIRRRGVSPIGSEDRFVTYSQIFTVLGLRLLLHALGRSCTQTYPWSTSSKPELTCRAVIECVPTVPSVFALDH